MTPGAAWFTFFYWASDPTQSACDGRARSQRRHKFLKQGTQSERPQVLPNDFADFSPAPEMLDLHTGNKQNYTGIWLCERRRCFSRILMELQDEKAASCETGNMPVLKGSQLHIHPWFYRHENCIFQYTQGVSTHEILRNQSRMI